MRYSVLAAAAAAGMLGGWAAPVFSQLAPFYQIQEETRTTQTGPTNVTTDGVAFVATAGPNDDATPLSFDGATLTLPAASALSSPVTMTPQGVNFVYSSGTITPAASSADYPINGNYTFKLTDSSNASDTASETVNPSIFTNAPATTPALTAASYTALQGMDSTKAMTVTFNSFADENSTSFIFFAVTDLSNDVLLEDGLQPTATQDTIAANLLSPGTEYRFFIFFENVAFNSDNNAQITLDNRTDGTFTTASVPEPASAVTGILGICGLCSLRRRERIANRLQ